MTFEPNNESAQTLTAKTLTQTIQAWQAGQAPREAIVGLLTSLATDQGELIQQVVQQLSQWVQAAPNPQAGHPAEATATVSHEDPEGWRNELMSSRARSWNFPHSAGLLVSPHVIILTDGQHGVILSQHQTRALPTSTSGSLLLLCQTIVMAQNAVDEKELGQLRQQRIESTSTSLSEIEPIH